MRFTRDERNEACVYGLRDGCWHHECRLAKLRAIGRQDVAAKLDRNADARDWLGNWGKMVYDRERQGRDAKRRKVAAEIVRAMRNGGIGTADAVITGAWVGATL